MIKIGFTGTREGMTEAQKAVLFGMLLGFRDSIQLHHGDCIGADEQAHQIAIEMNVRVVIHPSDDSSARAFCLGSYSMRFPKGYLDRDRDIVHDTELLIATPKENQEQRRGGTWFTIRYARSLAKPITIILPSGETRIERWKRMLA